MNESTEHGFSRREFLAGTSLMGAATLIGLPRSAAAEPPPETTKIRFVHGPWLCYAPQYLAEELLRMEGFTEVEYQKIEINIPATLVQTADLGIVGAPGLIPVIDSGMPVSTLAGLHNGCWELFGNERIQSIRDLKGKSVAVSGISGPDHVWIASMLAYVGANPQRDVNWVATGRIAESMRLFVEGKVDAFLGFPPQPQEMRARKLGRVIVNTTLDRPWSQYFCCLVVANREFVARHPVATKRALRALLKAADICAQEPERAARFLVTKGYEPRYEIGLEVLKSLPYDQWRKANPEDTLRFHALRLHEVGMIKSDPKKIIAQGTDWRFLNELKKELKA
jgi:NitT/TauT family transport system substrate-binding protein